MPTINFLLRGERKQKTIYFRYRPSKNFDLCLKTPYSISEMYWDKEAQQWSNIYYTERAKSSDKKLLNKEIEDFNQKLNDFKKRLSKEIEDNGNLKPIQLKSHIKRFIIENYFAHKLQNEDKNRMPENFYSLIDYYIDYRSIEDKTKGTKPISENTIKKYKTLQNVVSGYNKKLLVTQINNLFRNKFVEYLNTCQYSDQTQVKFIKDIKMLCKFASTEYDISKQVLNWEINSNVENVSEYHAFTLEQLSKIKNATLPEHLDNDRDWLLISCLLAVRVSELLSLDENNIISDTNTNRKFIKVFEKKKANTKSEGIKYLYLLPDVLDILEKRNGKFPRKISDQKYNENIKKVCHIAGLTEIKEGAKRELVNGKYRKIKSTGELWEFITSHCGRATYVTLFSEYLPEDLIRIQTNHESAKMVAHYNKTDLEVQQLQKLNALANAHDEVKLKIV